MTDMNKVVIIGGGHNGLICAAYLAKAGKQVTVLEASDQVGGAAITREFAPDFKVSAGAHLLYLLDKDVRKDLSLDAHGLQMSQKAMSTIALAENGQHLTFSGDQVSGEGVSAEDKAAMVEYHRFMTRFAGIIGKLHKQKPPRVRLDDRSDLISLAKTAWSIRSMGKADMREFLRITGINIYDVLKENFDHPMIRGALSLDGVLGSFLGPRSNNSVFCALHRWSGSQGMSIAKGGMGAVTQALADAAEKHGANIRKSSPVARILMENGSVQGVELEDGEQVMAGTVVSNADPKTTFFDLLGARHLEAGLVRKIQNIRMRGNASKLHLALNGVPEFTGLNENQGGERLVIAPDIEYVERAFNNAKYGEHSTQAIAEISIPSLNDDSLAPAGQHVLSAVVQYTPYELKAGWPNARQAFTDQVIDMIAQYAPGIREQIVHTELLTPVDIEREFRIHGGHWHHGELALDQFLMMRPAPGISQYQGQVDGLYLCGAGSHPGGGVMGSAGRNAANAVLATKPNSEG
jgi:phytoene dehydrogenase-like protein